MKRTSSLLLFALLILALSSSLAHAEILAMLNYETKPEQIVRNEGLAVIDVDPKSSTFGKLRRFLKPAAEKCCPPIRSR